MSHPVPISPTAWATVLATIAADSSLEEVILSGGDPLTLDDRLLADLAGRLSEITHLRRLRIHTRLPIVIPQRVTDALLGWLRGTRLTTLVVVHVNHPAEIDQEVAVALGRLVDAGVPVLSQTVLLREVNDCVEVLAELFGRLVDLRVMPYYLHQLDPVAGAAHFAVPEETGRAGPRACARLPGYAVPRYVRRRSMGRARKCWSSGNRGAWSVDRGAWAWHPTLWPTSLVGGAICCVDRRSGRRRASTRPPYSRY